MSKKDRARLKKQLWQAFLKSSVIISLINFFVCGCCIESPSKYPLYIAIASLLWLGFMAIANLPKEEKGEYEEWN